MIHKIVYYMYLILKIVKTQYFRIILINVCLLDRYNFQIIQIIEWNNK